MAAWGFSEEEAAAGKSRNCPRRLHSGQGGGGGTVPATQPTPRRASAARRGDGQLWEGEAHRPGQAHAQATAENRINLLVKSQGSKGGSRQSMS